MFYHQFNPFKFCLDELKRDLDETKQELSKSGNDDSYKKIQALQV